MQQLPVYTANIDVHVPSFTESLKRLIQGDPDDRLKYGLPGGGGFIFFAGVFAALWKWLKKRGSKPKKKLVHVPR